MSVQVIDTIDELCAQVASVHLLGKVVGLVPTMGALHAGHVGLIDRAVEECDLVIVSLFVNPTQFNRQDDFDRYPRIIEDDLAVCTKCGADILFTPATEEMYTGQECTTVDVAHLTDHLCGSARPGHFRGVATVVVKLLNISRADRAYFGEKDAQQLTIIKRVVKDLNILTKIVPVPTVREADGLACSSRNQHLTVEDRKNATMLYQALVAAKDAIAIGEQNTEVVIRIACEYFKNQSRARVEYFEIVGLSDMQPVKVIQGPVCVATAVWIGQTRLIDNVLCFPDKQD